MNEYEEKFLKEIAEPIFEEYKKEVMIKLLENEEKLKNQILNTLENIAGKARKIERFNVRYIDFSLLQIEFLKEKYELAAVAYDENRYLNEGIWEVFSVEYIFKELNAIKKSLYKDIKRYVGNIRPCSIDNYILKQLHVYNIYFTYFFIKLLKQLDEEESFLSMPKSETFQISFGEYKNHLQKIYYYDNSLKNEELFKEKIQKGKPEELVFSNWTSMELDNVKIENQDISCMNLKESELKNMYFLSSIAVGLNLKKANLKRCFFRNCDLKTSDFNESNLEDVIFENCVLANANFKDAGFKNVYLSNGKKMRKIINKEDFAYPIC